MGGEGINKALFIYNFISCVLEEIQVPQDCTGAESELTHKPKGKVASLIVVPMPRVLGKFK